MAFDAPATLGKIYDLVGALDGLQDVQLGTPKTFPKKVSAFVTLGVQTVGDHTSGSLQQRELRIFVGFGYRVDDLPGAGETTIARAVDALVRAILSDRTLGGVVASTRLEVGGSDLPRYPVLAGAEFRFYPVTVITTQYETIVSV